MVCKSPTALRRAHARRPRARAYSAYERAHLERVAREGFAALLSECTATPPSTYLLLPRDMSGFAGLQGASAHAERKRPRASITKDDDWKVRITGRAPDVYINGRLYTDHKGEGVGTEDGLARRNQESNWELTINTNRKYSELDLPIAKQCFTHALESLRPRLAAGELLIYGPVHPEVYGNDIPSDVIKSFQMIYSQDFEVGPQSGRLHTHLHLYFRHVSQIQLDNNEFRSEFLRLWNECAGNRLAPLNRVNIKFRRNPASWEHDVKIAYAMKDSLIWRQGA